MRDNEIQWKKINSKSCEKTKRGNEPRLGQKRFFKVSNDSSNDLWNIPIGIQVGSRPLRSVLLTEQAMQVDLGVLNCKEKEFILVNQDKIGFFRVCLSFLNIHYSNLPLSYIYFDY